MEGRALIQEIVRDVAPNAAVIGIEEDGERYRVRLTGTSGVIAACELERDTVEAAGHRAAARERLALALQRCADDVDARIPDGRG